MADTKLDIDEEIRKRGEANAKAYLDMEEPVNDLHRLAAIAEDYTIKLFHSLNQMRKDKYAREVDKHLDGEEEENLIFLFGQLEKASAKLVDFFRDRETAGANNA